MTESRRGDKGGWSVRRNFFFIPHIWTISKLLSIFMLMNYYTNGAYIIKGNNNTTRLRGRVIGSKYPSVYEVGERVNLPMKQFHKIDKTMALFLSKMI